jgi:hypothetical protein
MLYLNARGYLASDQGAAAVFEDTGGSFGNVKSNFRFLKPRITDHLLSGLVQEI